MRGYGCLPARLPCGHLSSSIIFWLTVSQVFFAAFTFSQFLGFWISLWHAFSSNLDYGLDINELLLPNTGF